MEVTDHVDIEKVMQREMRKHEIYVANQVKVARLQGQWTATKSLQHQAELLGTEGPIMQQFAVHLESVEKRLAELGAVRPPAEPAPHPEGEAS